jgi:protein-S-isoprenylcysteine O-methyltransferase Ste14
MKEYFTYPHLLVTAQFGLIGLMILFSHGILYSQIAIVVLLAGAIFGFWAITYNKLGNFHIRPVIKKGCSLITTGPYRYIRHPMYTSVIVMMLGIFISTPTLPEGIMLSLLILVLNLKARREERLWCGHDPEYLSYKKRTKLFIPFIL